MKPPPLVCHIVYRLDFGGLENGLVNLVNHLPAGEYRHVIVALTAATEFTGRIEREDVEVHSLGKRPGKDPLVYLRLFALLRRLQPTIVHTRNLGTLDCQIVAWAAGVPVRIHGEHGWEIHDPEGSVPRYVRLRRLMNPFIHRYVALSGEIEGWLIDDVRVGSDKVVRICNGVDSERFVPKEPEGRRSRVTIGTVTRFSDIKDPLVVVDAFARLASEFSDASVRPCLVMIGDGPLKQDVERRVREVGIEADVELPGAQLDVVPWLQGLDVFVLASRREGISNTILEAMSCGLPVVATRTGGNPELVDEPATGALVAVGDVEGLAKALSAFVRDPCRRRQAGHGGRKRVLERFSLNVMVDRYARLYLDELRGQS